MTIVFFPEFMDGEFDPERLNNLSMWSLVQTEVTDGKVALKENVLSNESDALIVHTFTYGTYCYNPRHSHPLML